MFNDTNNIENRAKNNDKEDGNGREDDDKDAGMGEEAPEGAVFAVWVGDVDEDPGEGDEVEEVDDEADDVEGNEHALVEV